MPSKDNDHLDSTPSIKPAKDDIATFQRSQKSKAGRLGNVPEVGGEQRTGMKALMALMLVGLLATAGLALYLHEQLKTAELTLKRYEVRVANLEERLSVTDESMSESSVAMKVKLRELDGEVRKLWDNVWKRSKQRFATIEASIAEHDRSIKSNASSADAAAKQLAKNKNVITGLSSELQEFKRLESLLSGNQAKIVSLTSAQETSSDKVNRLANKTVKLDKLSGDNKERLDSVDGFRRQANKTINDLKQEVGRLQEEISRKATPLPVSTVPSAQ